MNNQQRLEEIEKQKKQIEEEIFKEKHGITKKQFVNLYNEMYQEHINDVYRILDKKVEGLKNELGNLEINKHKLPHRMKMLENSLIGLSVLNIIIFIFFVFQTT